MPRNGPLLIECRPGWSKLYLPLINLCEIYGVNVDQIKEKFGGLRFYASGERIGEVIALIHAAENASWHTCEVCGEDRVETYDRLNDKIIYKATTDYTGWRQTLCRPCREALKSVQT